MKKILLLIAGFSFLALAALFSTNILGGMDKQYDWNRVDSLENEGLYRSALELVERIYMKAKQDADQSNEIKALIYRLKYQQELSEDGQETAISELIKELPDNRPVPASIKYSLLAELYHRYYSANRWEICQRTDVEGISGLGISKGFNDWGPGRFYEAIAENYAKSLADADQLLEVPLESLKEIWIGNWADTVYCPTLYDIMMRRVTGFIESLQEFPVFRLRPAVTGSPGLFAPAGQFVKLAAEQETGTGNPWLWSLGLYGSWLDKRMSAFENSKTGNSNLAALLAVDLNRLEYAHQQSCHVKRDSLCEAALIQWTEKLEGDSLSAAVYFKIGQMHASNGDLFVPNDPDTSKYKWEHREALKWLKKAEKWKNTSEGKNCSNLIRSIESPVINPQSESILIPDKPFPVSLSYRNLKQAFYRIYRTDAKDYYSGFNSLEGSDRLKWIENQTFIRSGRVLLPDDGDLNLHRINLIMDPVSAGFYLVSFASSDDWKEKNVIVECMPVSFSGINYVSRLTNKGEREFFFRDRSGGFALPRVAAIPWYEMYDMNARRVVFEKGRKRTAGSDGSVVITDGSAGQNDPSRKAYRLQLISGQDSLFTPSSFYPGYVSGKQQVQVIMNLYTDRSLYKPGQTVFFRGILLDQYQDSLGINKAESITLNLQDPRYQNIKTETFQVDKLGVFTGWFELPLKGLTGSYIINSKYGQQQIRMEQYRRPGFFIQIGQDHRIIPEGGELIVTGTVTALSGEPVANPEMVVETEIQQMVRPGRWNPIMGQKIRIHTGKLFGDGNGRFTWKWNTLQPGQNPYSTGSFTRYVVTFRATDPNGETQQEQVVYDCGTDNVSLVSDIREEIMKAEEFNFTICAVNSDGRQLMVPASIRIDRLIEPARVFIDPVIPLPDRFVHTKTEWYKKIENQPFGSEHLKENWTFGSTVYQSDIQIDSVANVAVGKIAEWKEGWYRLQVTSGSLTDKSKLLKYFYVKPPISKSIPYGRNYRMETSPGTIKTGAKFSLTLVAEKKSTLLVDLRVRNNTLESKWIQAGNKTTDFTWPVTEAWQGGASVRVISLANNRIYEKSVFIDVPWEGKKLTLTGLDELKQAKPGDSISLKIKIKDEYDRPVVASLGLTVYDASLDRITAHQWTGISWPKFYSASTWELPLAAAVGAFPVLSPQVVFEDPGYIEPLTLNWFGMGYYGITRMDAPMMMKSVQARPEAGEAGRNMVQDISQAAGDRGGRQEETPVKPDIVDSGRQAQELPAVQIRSDFRETAFFNGNIITDKNGESVVSFKLPEVFTEWKILAITHNRDLAMGEATHIFKSNKDLMLKHNFPPFLRKGDTVDLAARLGWYGDGLINAKTTMELRNGAGKLISSFVPDVAALVKGEVKPFYWKFAVPGNENLNFLVKSEAGVDSDGIQDSIPVYPDDVMLWKSQPFYFNKEGSKQITVGANPMKAIIEVTTTPAWQVLLSLPVIYSNEKDCSEYWFSRFYLANITGLIADRIPAIADWFLKKPVEEILDSLSHPLFRNVAVKGKRWEDTPWSPMKENEAARIRQIKEWMDKDKRQAEIIYTLEKLADLQNQDGTWPWFRGMGQDWYMTQQILAGFAELKGWRIMDVTATQRGTSMINRAIEALDGWMTRQFRELMKADSALSQKMQLNPLIINYLYTRSSFLGLSFAPKDEIAWLHFIERIGMEWMRHDPALQALMALTYVQAGKAPLAMPIYKSLRERMLSSDEMGLYWPRKGYASDWYQWDLWMQSRMIELFAAIEDGRKDLDQLRLYLVHQKRGRDWGNGMVATWAARSMLFYGSDLLTKPASIDIQWGRERFIPLRIATGSAGPSGYYSFAWNEPEEIPADKSINISHTGGGPAWGTVYSLNGLRLDELAASEGPLVIAREVMVGGDTGTWKNIKSGQVIHTGQQIRIKLTLKSDRDLSYVEVKDFLGTGCIPFKVLSGYHYNAGLFWYQAREPESVLFYLQRLPKGTQTLDYIAVAEQAGNYFGGYAAVQSLYAPEFRAWSNSLRINARR